MLSHTKRKININPDVKASSWYIASNIISRALTVLATPIFTRLLTAEEYGIYPLYVSFMGIFTVIATFEISGAVIYGGLSEFGEKSARGFILSALVCEAALSLSFLTIYILFKNLFNAITTLSTRLTLMLILQVFLNSALGIYFSENRFFRRYKSVTAVNILTGVMTPLLSLAFIFLGFRGISRILAPLTISLFVCAFIVYSMVKKGISNLKSKYFKYIFAISLPMLPHYLSLSVMAGAEKIIISRLLGDAALGKYSAAYSVGFVVSLVSGGVATALSPWIMKKISEGKLQSINKVAKSAEDLISIAALIFLAVAPEIFRIAADGSYYEALGVIYPVAVSTVFTFLSNLTVSAAMKLGKTKSIMKNSVLSMLMFFVLSIFLVEALGYIGGALSTLAISVIRLFMNARTLGNSLICNTRRIFGSFIFLSVFAFLLFLFKEAPVSRILLAIALLIMLLSESKQYKSLLFRKTEA